MDKLVSVVVPVYNVEKYLKKCVKTIIEQTYNNLEIILVNDGSTDSSGIICDDFSKNDKRIKVYHKENEGLGITRNYGIERSHGDYLMLVDSDDYLDMDAIRRMVKTASTENADLIIEGFTKVTSEGKFLFKSHYQKQIFEGSEVINSLLARMIGSCPEKQDSIFTIVTAKLYDLHLIHNNHILFCSERDLQSEDLVFQLACLPYIHKAIITADNCYYYRTNNCSLSKKYKENRFEEVKKVYYYVRDRIKEINMPQETYLRLDKMLFVHLRSVLAQERPNISGKSKQECQKKIEMFVNDKLVQERITLYPINKLKFKQRLFLWLIKNKLVKALYWTVK